MLLKDDCGNVLGTRKQIPLDLAYCMTIHKSQGMEFDYLEVDLSDVFDPGQAYVAASRAKTLNGLRILGVHPALPKTSELVEQFYKTEVVNVEDVDMKQLLKEKKKRSTNTLQFVDIKSCKKVASVVSDPCEFVLSEEYESGIIPSECFDAINSKFQALSKINNDTSYVSTEFENTKGILKFCTWLWNLYRSHHISSQPSNKVNEENNQVENMAQESCLTNEAKAKIRNIDGWVVYKEIEFCASYIRNHKGSTSPKCLENVALNRRLKALLMLMKDTRGNVLSSTKYPDSLHHITMDDRGGKTNIIDCVFEFFQQLSAMAFQLFSDKNFQEHKQNVLSIAYSMMKSNASLQSSFQILMGSISLKLSSEVSGFESSSTNSSHCNTSSKSNVVEAMDCTSSSTFKVFESSGLQTPWQKYNENDEFESCVDNCDTCMSTDDAIPTSIVDLTGGYGFDSGDCSNYEDQSNISIDREDLILSLPSEESGKCDYFRKKLS